MKKVLALALSLALIATLAISGTIAYLTDTDKAVNVMTLGNVDIEQIEQEYDGNGALVDFTQGKPLYPYVGKLGWENDEENGGAYRKFTMENAVDKYVSVKNTGKSDAYVRTIIALEQGTESPEVINNYMGISVNAANGSEYKFEGAWIWDAIGTVKIDGNYYDIMVATHEAPVPAGETTIPSLLQVYLKETADNEQVEQLDGNDNGLYDILVVSQAVQIQGFGDADTALNTAFGEANAENVAKWLGGMDVPETVSTAAELSAALAAGKSVVLTEDVTVTSTITIPKNTSAKLDLAGNDLSYAVENDNAAAIITNNGTLEIAGTGTISFTAANPDLGTIPTYATNTITNEGTLVIGEGVTITNGSDGGASYAVDNKGKFTMNGGTLIGDRCALRIAKFNQDNVVFVMNGGVVKAATPAWVQLPGSSPSDAPTITVTINDGTFESTKASHADNDVLYTYSFGNSYANTSLTINGGNFKGGTVSIGSDYTGAYATQPTLNITGGTFDYDVLKWTSADTSEKIFAANN